MLKTSIFVLAAMLLVGASEAGDSYTEPQGTWQVATGENAPGCPPSSCPWMKESTKMAREHRRMRSG